MPHPMSKMPTLGEFIEKVKHDYGVTVETPDTKFIDAKGEVALPYLKRVMASKTRVAAVPGIHSDQRLIPSVLQSLCSQLDIPLADFGLSMD